MQSRRLFGFRYGGVPFCFETQLTFPLPGGHTSEALTLTSALDFRRYNHRIYLVSEGDFLSARKALDFETRHGNVGEPQVYRFQ